MASGEDWLDAWVVILHPRPLGVAHSRRAPTVCEIGTGAAAAGVAAREHTRAHRPTLALAAVNVAIWWCGTGDLTDAGLRTTNARPAAGGSSARNRCGGAEDGKLPMESDVDENSRNFDFGPSRAKIPLSHFEPRLRGLTFVRPAHAHKTQREHADFRQDSYVLPLMRMETHVPRVRATASSHNTLRRRFD